MTQPSPNHDLEARLGHLLRAGVLLAAAFVIAGGVLYLVRHGGEAPAYGQFRSEPSEYRSVAGVLRGAFGFQGRGIIQLGLLLLIATPIARVALAGLGFLRRADWKYVIISTFVLVLLLFGLVSGH